MNLFNTTFIIQKFFDFVYLVFLVRDDVRYLETKDRTGVHARSCATLANVECHNPLSTQRRPSIPIVLLILLPPHLGSS